jgi:hypothetical protein
VNTVILHGRIITAASFASARHPLHVYIFMFLISTAFPQNKKKQTRKMEDFEW